MKIIIAVLLPMVHLAAAEVKYYGTEDSLVLRPTVSGAITSITWKHKGNIAAEWIKDSVPLEYLGDLKGRLDLDLTTGILTVNNMTKADEGVFNVEINNKVLPDTFEATWIMNLNDHHFEVIATPLTCSSLSTNCSLRCGEEIKGAGPIQYSWKKGAGEWEQGERVIVIEKNDETLRFETFTCKAKNPISEKESKPEKNPFNNTEPVNAGLVIGIVLLILVIIGGIVGVMWIKKLGPFKRFATAESHRGNMGNEEKGEPMLGYSVPDPTTRKQEV